MDYEYILHVPPPTDGDESKPVSTFTQPIFIDMGEETSENLEAKVKERTNESVKADEQWTPLEGTRAIDASVVAGFLFQSDAGSGCSIKVTENGNRPVRILIDRENNFDMFLVVVLRHEEWTTAGEFYLRFLRRVPVPDKRCTARTEGPFAGPVPSPSSYSSLSGTEAPESPTANPMDVVVDQRQRVYDWLAGISTSPPPQTPSEEYYRAIAAAALRGDGDGDGVTE